MKINKLRNKILTSKKKGISLIILVFSVIAIFSFAGLIVDLGIILNCRYELQKAVETAALASISDYEAYTTGNGIIAYPDPTFVSSNGDSIVNNNINAFIKSNSFLLMSTDITPTITFGATNRSKYSRAIRIETSAVAKTYFLSLIGIRSIKIQAAAAAMHVPVYLRNGNILAGCDFTSWPMACDMDLREPVGGSVPHLPTISNVNTSLDNLYGIHDGRVVSLGPGGFITIKLPATLIDGKGFDLQIIQQGNANGYFVFAGNDIDASNPYIDTGNPGSGIQWVNISCTGTPIGTLAAGGIQSFTQRINRPTGAVDESKFYGSAYFDLGARCSSGYNANISTAKYLKIIDDNREDSFSVADQFVNSGNWAPMFNPGQHSSFTPGASFDSIAVSHHSRLIRVSDFDTDTDGDGLIDVLERSLGLNPNGSSDGSATSYDAGELWGYDWGVAASDHKARPIQNYPTSFLRLAYPKSLNEPPLIFINY